MDTICIVTNKSEDNSKKNKKHIWFTKPRYVEECVLKKIHFEENKKVKL